MNPLLNPRREIMLQAAVDVGERLVVLTLFAGFVVRLSHTLIFRPYNLLVLLSEGLVAFLIIARRSTPNFTMRPMDWTIAMAGTALPMLLRAGGTALLPVAVGTLLMSGGLLFAIWAKINLWRSFGIAAANRGPVERGPYRFVRHPMYAGYFLVDVGFILNNPLIWNSAVYSVAVALQIMRILAEERILTADPLYADYRNRVRYRLLPRVF